MPTAPNLNKLVHGGASSNFGRSNRAQHSRSLAAGSTQPQSQGPPRTAPPGPHVITTRVPTLSSSSSQITHPSYTQSKQRNGSPWGEKGEKTELNNFEEEEAWRGKEARRRMAVEYRCCGAAFFEHIAIIVVLVLFAGLMSGLTLGLMSLSLVDLEVLAKSGTDKDRKYAAKILPVVKNQHLLLCTLLICNACAMEALPIFLDSLVTAWGAVLISVTLILLFGEILPQSICSRYGLAIGALVAPLVRVLVWICFPVAYPIAKLLDHVLGHGKAALFRRAELKTLVTLHGNEAGKGGELTHDETTIIAGALELSEKKAKDAMTPLCDTFVIDINAKLDRKLMQEVIEKGHSRVPVYYEKDTNIIGLILVKNLLSINPDDEIPIKSVTIRKIPRVSEDMPLYDILNEFQKGHSHMAVVIRQNIPDYPAKQPNNDGETLEVAIAIDDKQGEKVAKNLTPLRRWKSYPNTLNSNTGSRSRKWSKDQSDVLQVHEEPLPTLSEDEEAVGIITMEDVIEELLQEEIYDETDVHAEEQ